MSDFPPGWRTGTPGVLGSCRDLAVLMLTVAAAALLVAVPIWFVG